MKYNQMNNKELWNAFNKSEIYKSEMCEEICYRVGMLEDYYLANDENIDSIVEEAVEKLEEQLKKKG